MLGKELEAGSKVTKDNYITLLKTEKGAPTSAGINVTEYTIEVVVSADIIEYY